MLKPIFGKYYRVGFETQMLLMRNQNVRWETDMVVNIRMWPTMHFSSGGQVKPQT